MIIFKFYYLMSFGPKGYYKFSLKHNYLNHLMNKPR